MPLLFWLDEGLAQLPIGAATTLGFTASVSVPKALPIGVTAADVTAAPTVDAITALVAQVAGELAFGTRRDAVAPVGLTAAAVTAADAAATILAEAAMSAAAATAFAGGRHALAEVALDTAASLVLVAVLQWAAAIEAEANAEVGNQATLQGASTLGIGAVATLLPAALLNAVAAASLTHAATVSSQAGLMTRVEGVGLAPTAAVTWGGGLAYLQTLGLSATTATDVLAAVQAVGALALGVGSDLGVSARRTAAADVDLTAAPAVAPGGHLATRIEAVVLDGTPAAALVGRLVTVSEVDLPSAAAAGPEAARTAPAMLGLAAGPTFATQCTLAALGTLGLAVQAALTELGIPPGDALDIIATGGLAFAATLVAPGTWATEVQAAAAPAASRTVPAALALDAVGAGLAASAGWGARADWSLSSMPTMSAGAGLAAQAALAIQASAALADMVAGSGDVSAALTAVPGLSFLPQVTAAGALGLGVVAAEQAGAQREATAALALAATTGLPVSTVRTALAQVGLSATATLSDVISEIGAVVLQATPHLGLDARVVAGAELGLPAAALVSAAAAAHVLAALGLPLDPSFWAGLAGEEIEQLVLYSPLLSRLRDTSGPQRVRLANRPSRIRRRP